MSHYIIEGRTIDANERNPLAGLRVETWDADGLCSRLIAAATTDAAGLFRIEFSIGLLRELLPGRKPDLYFKVFAKDELVADTRHEVLWNIGCGKRHVEIEVPSKDAPQRDGHSVGVRLAWDDGTPAVGLMLEVAGDGARGRAQTDALGVARLVLDAKATGDVAIAVRDDKGVALLDTKITLGSGKTTVDLGLPPEARIDPERPRKRIPVGPYQADAAAIEEYGPAIVADIARVLRGKEGAEKLRAKIGKAIPGLLDTKKQPLCGNMAMSAVRDLMRAKGWAREHLLDFDDIITSGSPGFAERTYDCTNFRITYFDEGTDAVPLDNSEATVVEPGTTTVLGTLPAGGAPTYVKRVCFWLDRALALYTAPPFSMLNPAASGRIAVRIQNFPTRIGTGDASGMIIHNALSDDLICAVAVHELMHVIQWAGYPLRGQVNWFWSFAEGGAVFAEDAPAEQMNRYLDEAGTNFNGAGVMSTPEQSLSSASYKASLFWRYVAEQHSGRINPADEPSIGVETYRILLERASAGTYTDAEVRAGIRELPWYQDFYEFGFLDAARRDRTSSETTLGNFYLACYLKDLGTNVPDRRFDFMEDEENIFIDDVLRASIVPTAPAQGTLASVTRTTNALGTSGAVNITNTVSRFSARFHEVTVDPAVTSVRIAFTAAAGLTSSLFQIVLIDDTNAVRDIIRSDAATFTKTVANTIGARRLARVVLVPVGAASAGSYTINVTPVAAAPDVMVTRWHSRPGTEYEVDSLGWGWTWVSPDIWVDNGADGVPDPEVYFDFDNRLNIRLRNKGNADATGISVQFWYQDASPGLSDAAWTEVRDRAGTIQTLSSLTLARNSTNNWSVPWSPTPSGASRHFCVRAVVTVPGDPNTDNKRVLSNFGNVIVRPGGFFDLAVSRHNLEDLRGRGKLEVIPRAGRTLRLAPSDLERLAQPPAIAKLAAPELLRLRHVATKAVEHVESKVKSPCPCAHAVRRLERSPDPNGHYPVDPELLPPGYADRPMITVVHTVDGLATGGVTYLVSESERKR